MAWALSEFSSAASPSPPLAAPVRGVLRTIPPCTRPSAALRTPRLEAARCPSVCQRDRPVVAVRRGVRWPKREPRWRRRGPLTRPHTRVRARPVLGASRRGAPATLAVGGDPPTQGGTPHSHPKLGTAVSAQEGRGDTTGGRRSAAVIPRTFHDGHSWGPPARWKSALAAPPPPAPPRTHEGSFSGCLPFNGPAVSSGGGRPDFGASH